MRKFIQIIESVTNDHALNDMIEHRLKSLPAEDQTIALDGLELIYNRGAHGISVSDWVSQMGAMWPTSDEQHLRHIFKIIRDSMPEHIKHTGDAYVFHMPVSTNAAVDTTSPLAQAAGQQIELTSTILDVCRDLGRFTMTDVLHAVVHRTHQPAAVLRMFIEHVFQSNPVAIKHEAGEFYTFQEPLKKTSSDHMSFWRELARRGGAPKA